MMILVKNYNYFDFSVGLFVSIGLTKNTSSISIVDFNWGSYKSIFEI